MGQVRGSRSVPVAGLAELLAAYVVLSDHRLAPGADGPAIPVTAVRWRRISPGRRVRRPKFRSRPEESLSELKPSKSCWSTREPTWRRSWPTGAAGSVSAFVVKMNAAAGREPACTATHITDPSGVDPATTSTAEDLIRLGEASLSIPVLRQIVSLGQASVPMTTVVFNPNFDLGQDGIIGIKTASDSSAQGCYLVAAQQNIGGKDVTVVGAVLGQPGGSLGPNAAGIDAGDALVRSVFAALHTFTVFAPDQKVAEVQAAWGSVAPVTVAQPVDVIGWPGLVVTLEVRHRRLDGPLPSGSIVGTLRAGVGRVSAPVDLRTTIALSSPGVWWRLTR